MKGRRHSLSARLLGLFLLTAALLALVVHIGFRQGVSHRFRDLTRPHLTEYVNHLLTEIGDPPNIERARALSKRLPVSVEIRGPSVNWSSGGEVPETDKFRFHVHTLPDDREVQIGRHERRFMIRAQTGEHTVSLYPSGLEDLEGTPWAALLTIAGVLAVLVLSYHAIRRLFQPVEAIRRGVARFGAGELEHRIDIRRRDELGELAESVNEMAGEIERMLEAKRQLLLAISHELRSPLTRAKVNLELLEDAPERRDLARDLNEIEGLLAELLESERLNSRHASLHQRAVDPAVLIQEVIRENFAEKEIRSRLNHTATFISLDPVRIRLLIRNLLDNALRHTPGGASPPEIISEYRDDQWRLTIHDHGPGIPGEHLPQLTEPFYRADPARRRETGGYGLGLYLCKMIAEAHGGRLEIESKEGSGTTVKVSVPLVAG